MDTTGNEITRKPFAWHRGRTLWLTTALLSLAAVVVLGYFMAQRLDRYNRDSGRELYVFQPITAREFLWNDTPVSFTDEVDADGADVVVLRYGQDTIRLRSGLTSLPTEVPGLQRHDAWLKVLRFAPRSGKSIEELMAEIDAGTADERLAAVVRLQRPGVDQDSFGQVMRGDWRFQFVELLPEGGFREQVLRFPESERAFNRRVSEARRAGEPAPERRDDELQFGTWQFDASLMVMPKSGPPAPQFGRGAMDALGWTLPVATLLFFVSTISIAMAFAPERVRPEDLEAASN
ncbi:hypothetical protein AY599_19570 [Leptolyngbya valderiana BDU 20041]|nr:hypothetical protein AY599_19570 [Leptolyngbya valderiana BDU 20041]